ncbi:uncharacterized protein kek5 [Anabrus simplex]|uniref:uncharacterized protein kek5 n=1 Tax=Anabrus simplex TaxID=316456 RepID=UPI0034DD643E
MAARSLLLVVLALLCLAASEEDWSNCPTVCKCKWVSGKKAAECTNASLTTIPSGLSAEIQSLDVSGNRIPALVGDAFKSVGLINLHKAYLRECEIQELHKEAFHGLQILIELDLTGNRIHSLHPGTFKDNVRLRILYLNRNPIQKVYDGVFSNLPFLQTVEMSECQIAHIGHKAFSNVPNLQSLRLDRNNLTNMKPDILKHMDKLKSLELYNNPWNCDCHLKAFRDWIIQRNLYAQPTACHEPPSLHGKLWSDLESDSLACKPQIMNVLPSDNYKAGGGNVTMSCLVVGNPAPTVHWVYKHEIIGNRSRKTLNDHWYVVTENSDSPKWVNLTIVDARFQDQGEYACVARNLGGMDERKVKLEMVNGYGRAGGGVLSGSINDTWPWILGLAIGAVVLLVIVLILSYCFCRTRNPRGVVNKKNLGDGVSSNGDLSYHSGPVSEQEKSLITVVNPVQKPPRRYESLSTSTPNELEVKATLLDNGSVFIGPSVADSDDHLQDRSLDSLETIPQRSRETLDAAQTLPPDLLSFPSRASQVSPAGSTASTAPDNTRLPAQHGPQSPLQSPPFHHIFGTLPYSRSQSPFSPAPAAPPRGYVTIPRRPRVPSWSSAPNPSLAIDPLAYRLEPVYDNLGPRTTADGSSVLSLNKSLGSEQSPASGMRGRPLPPTPTIQGNNTLPPYYAPIAPIEEQPSPALPRANTGRNVQRSTPNISVASSPSPSPLPVNTPQKAPSKKDKPDSARQRASWARIAPEGASLKALEEELANTPNKRASTASTASSPSLNSPSGARNIKVPPKPPPKPKKKSDSLSNPLYEDEGEDGTEV